MAGLYSVVKPEATTNLVTNPSLEVNTSGWTARTNSSIVRSTTHAKFGAASLQVTTDGVGALEGADYTIALSASTQYTVSVWFRASFAGLSWLLNIYNTGTAATVANVAFTSTVLWQQITLTFTSTTSASYAIQFATDDTFLDVVWIDALQVEAKAYATTYCDGDQAGCLWNGGWHNSTSSRSARSRAGGRVWDLEDLMIFLMQHSGGGMAPVLNITSDYGLLPGSTYQRTKVMGRLLTLTLDQDDSGDADAWQALHDVRRDLIELFDPYGVEGSQATIVRYTGGSQDLEIDCFYDAGLEGGNAVGFVETATLRLLAPNPFWRQIGNTAKTLSVNETIADADNIVQRSKDGLWHALGGGVTAALSSVQVVAYGPDGAVYAAGSFAEAFNAAGTGSPVAASNIAKWTPNATNPLTGTWTALGATAGTNGVVYDIAVNAAGTILYVVGAFTTAGGVAAPGVAAYTIGTDTWSALGSGLTGGTATGTAVAVNHDGRVYVAGDFTAAGGVANTAYVAAWDGSAWSALGTGLNASANALAVAASGNVYVGGAFTLASGATVRRIGRWTPTNSAYAPDGTGVWAEVAGGIDNGTVEAVAIGLDNTIYVGGTFTLSSNQPQYIARTLGRGWLALGSTTALNDDVYDLHIDHEGDLLVGGEFSRVEGVAWPDGLARWHNHLGWSPFWIDLPSFGRVISIATYPDGPINPDTGRARTGRVAVGGIFTGTATASNIADHTITNDGSAPAAPLIHVTGPGVLESMVNMTTGRELFFNGQQIQAGEVAILDLRPGQLGFYTTTGRQLLNTILSSHPTSFRLLRGDNTVLVKMSGTTAASSIQFIWQELHWSYDV